MNYEANSGRLEAYECNWRDAEREREREIGTLVTGHSSCHSAIHYLHAYGHKTFIIANQALIGASPSRGPLRMLLSQHTRQGVRKYHVGRNGLLARRLESRSCSRLSQAQAHTQSAYSQEGVKGPRPTNGRPIG